MPGLDEDAFPKVVDIVADVAEMASMCHNSIYEYFLYRFLGKNKAKNRCFRGRNFSKVTLVLKRVFKLVFFCVER